MFNKWGLIIKKTIYYKTMTLVKELAFHHVIVTFTLLHEHLPIGRRKEQSFNIIIVKTQELIERVMHKY